MFDLDGTLLDTLADLAAAGNYALGQLDRPTHPLDAYRTLVGQGVRQLFVDALGPDHGELVDPAVSHFHDYYAEHRFDTTAPYDGIESMLSTLTSRGARLAVLSNKPHPATVDVVQRFFGRFNWSAVRGHMPDTQPKPDPTAAHEVIAEVGVPAARWMYVGDTRVDMLTGKSAGMFTVGVAWGFRSVEELTASGADAIVRSPEELVDLLK